MTQTLFVTRFGLSERTAIGAQTQHLLREFPSYLHWYWHEALTDSAYPGSRRIERLPFARIPQLKHRGGTALQALSWWRNDYPRSALLRRIEEAREKVSAVYLAPIGAQDARRMRAIVEIMNRPFALHLWDFLDNEGDEATAWLVREAEHVFCLNEPILASTTGARGASLLRFRRPPSRHLARFDPATPLTIAIMGDISAYQSGVRLLVAAVEALNDRGFEARITYIGNRRTLRRTGLGARPLINATGFLKSADDKDNQLTRCSIGFLPGPSDAPEISPRSRFSIPSRILDFMATGLPLVGSVHPHSATFDLCRHLGIERDLGLTKPETLADTLTQLNEEATWEAAHQRGLAAFDQLVAEYDSKRLRTVLNVS